MKAWLRAQGHGVNRKRVSRLMQLMGLVAVYPKPRLSEGGPDHKVYPLSVERGDGPGAG
jgi:putative transposase